MEKVFKETKIRNYHIKTSLGKFSDQVEKLKKQLDKVDLSSEEDIKISFKYPGSSPHSSEVTASGDMLKYLTILAKLVPVTAVQNSQLLTFKLKVITSLGQATTLPAFTELTS